MGEKLVHRHPQKVVINRFYSGWQSVTSEVPQGLIPGPMLLNTLHWKRFQLGIIRTFFTLRTINQWNHLPRDVVGSPSLEVFRMRLDRVLDNLI